MALVLADRVKVTTTTTGTGAVALGAAQAGYQDFSVLSDGDTTYYCIVDNATGAWEVGLGTYASAGPSLARTSVLASSTGTAVSFGAGPKDVFITLSAERVVTTDGADFTGPITVPGGATGAQVPRASEVGNLAVAQRADVFRRGNIIGTVSQSGGIPSGALIERDLNANGWYVRFADGTQISWRIATGGTTSTAMGSLFMTPSDVTGDWAAAFSVPPIAIAMTYGSTLAQCWCGDLNTTETGFSGLRVMSVLSTASANVRILAIGRWFV